ncbi:MAG: hypothetical protein ACT4R6_07825 [Gemmatimonadaceae bacterium]
MRVSPGQSRIDPRIVPVLRLAFLMGAGFLGGAVGFIRSRAPATVDPAAAATLTLAGRITWIVVLAVCLFLASRIRAQRDSVRALSLSIITWAVAESTAIFGAVYWFLFGSPNWYFPGLGLLALTLLALPGAARRA